MGIMTDDKLVEMTNRIDGMMADLIIEYKLPPLFLSAITLARLTLMCDEVGSGADFRTLAAELPPPLQSEVMH